MRAASESALALARQLRLLNDQGLIALIDAREIRHSGIRDFFDLADALLEQESIAHALGKLDRATLAALGSASDGAARASSPAESTLDASILDASTLDSKALDASTLGQLDRAVSVGLATKLDGVFAIPAPVVTELASWPRRGLPSILELRSAPAPAALVPVSSTDQTTTDSLAAERAFATTTAVAELIAELRHESARELARGGIALPDNKRLAGAMGVELESVSELVEIAERAGLVARENGRWGAADPDGAWSVAVSGARWGLLAGAWVERLPADIRAILAGRPGARWGDQLAEYVDWMFPAGGTWMHNRVATYTRDAELLGITAQHVPSTAGTALLAEGVEPAVVVMAALFPPEVESVYLQHDLSIVSPGPLAPAVDARLRQMATVEGRALASRYRVSTASLYRAMALGETAETMREFLSAISLTGIPQPLDYLLTEAAARYGLVRVGATADGRAYVRSTDVGLLRTLHVDQALTSLGLGVDGIRLVSRFDRDLVFWAISDARYPVAAENADGAIENLVRRESSAKTNAPSESPTIALIEKLRIGSSSDADATGKAWLSRQLDVAIRGKLAVTVTVQLPDGSSAHYQLEPASVGGGRLRAKDRKSDIERTLPLASITAVGPAL